VAGSSDKILDQTGAALRETVELPGEARTVAITLLQPNPWNPNKQDPETFRKEKVSLQRFGFVVPIIVRPVPGSKKFEIIDGEHRWKAAVELHMEFVPIFNIGPIPDHEAKQLTIVLNELRGKPDEEKLGNVLKDLLASDTLERLTEVLPYTKERFGEIAKLPEFDWGKLQQANENRAAASERRWVERIFRLPKETAEILDEAIKLAKADRDDIDDAAAIEAIAKEFIG